MRLRDSGGDGLIGLDWGTSNLRALRMDATGRVRETRARPWGIRRLPHGGFAAALDDIVAGWPRTLPLLACGMVGSRGGWREAPYVDVPAHLDQLAHTLATVPTGDGRVLHIVPGLRNARDPDVMRGEETQLAGGLLLHPEAGGRSTWILPGTHSKWAGVRGQAMTDFHTCMTGELFDVLCRHSILGTGMQEGREDTAAFVDAVRSVRDGGREGGLGRLFGTRARVLAGTLPPGSAAAHLSGLLIGEEIRSMLAGGRFDVSRPVWLIGEAALCGRYRQAAECFDVAIAGAVANATGHGLWHLAQQAGLAGHPRGHDDAETLA